MKEGDHKTKFQEFNLSHISYAACAHIGAKKLFSILTCFISTNSNAKGLILILKIINLKYLHERAA